MCRPEGRTHLPEESQADLDHTCFVAFFSFKRSEGWSLTAVNPRLWLAGGSDVFALTVAALNTFLLCSAAKPSSEAAAELLKPFSERAVLFSSSETFARVRVVVLRATARCVRLCVKPTSTVFLLSLFVRVTESQGVLGEFGCEQDWRHGRWMKLGGIFLRSPVAVNVVNLAPDQATARHFLLIVCPHRFFCDDKACKKNLLGEEKKTFFKKSNRQFKCC